MIIAQGGESVNSKRVIDALKVIKEEIPDYFAESIMSDCPSDLGLPAKYRKMCGMDSTTFEFTSEHCDRCWRLALGEEQ